MRRLVIGLLLQRYREADLAADAAAAAIAAAGAGVVAARMAEEECLRALALRRLWFLEGLRTAAAVGRRAAMAAAAAVRSARRGVQYSVVVAEVMRGQGSRRGCVVGALVAVGGGRLAGGSPRGHIGGCRCRLAAIGSGLGGTGPGARATSDMDSGSVGGTGRLASTWQGISQGQGRSPASWGHAGASPSSDATGDRWSAARRSRT